MRQSIDLYVNSLQSWLESKSRISAIAVSCNSAVRSNISCGQSGRKVEPVVDALFFVFIQCLQLFIPRRTLSVVPLMCSPQKAPPGVRLPAIDAFRLSSISRNNEDSDAQERFLFATVPCWLRVQLTSAVVSMPDSWLGGSYAPCGAPAPKPPVLPNPPAPRTLSSSFWTTTTSGMAICSLLATNSGQEGRGQTHLLNNQLRNAVADLDFEICV